jgi:parallel beta-helix repeat protein
MKLNRTLWVVVAAVSFSLISSSAMCATWYVRPEGSKVTLPANGSTIGNAFAGLASIPWGAKGVQPGDTVVLTREAADPAKFTGTMTIGTSGTSALPITIKGDPANPVSIIPVKSTYAAITATGRSWVNIQGISMSGGAGLFLYNCSYVIVSGCTYTGSSWDGIYLSGGSYNTITGNTVTASVVGGIALMGTATNKLSYCSVNNNTVSGCLGGDGITLHESNDRYNYTIGTGNQVTGNISHDNAGRGLDITSGTGTLVAGNRTYRNALGGATIYHDANLVTFTSNYSSSEQGLLLGGPGNDTISENVFDSGNTVPIWIGQGSNHLISNNVFLSSSSGHGLGTIQIAGGENITFQKNVIYNSNAGGFLLSITCGTTLTQNITFNDNCWFQPGGVTVPLTIVMNVIGQGSYQKFMSLGYMASNNLFTNPQLLSDFDIGSSSAAAGQQIGITIVVNGA